ncbi:MAG: hypothetical protein MOIL_01569 [Candidatus Methanolliviera sp. GoM_oil]|nr:MAG: hypothetical protein MOIL_01569 [Candidatus Methanolliviera sp. GoM_oil]
MIDELDQIILRMEFVRDRAEDDEIVGMLNGIINDLCEWEDRHLINV